MKGDTMKLTHYIACSALIFLNLYADVENSIDPVFKEEFSIAEYWHDGMTWGEFLEIRNGLRRLDLVKYLDKIEQQKMAKEAGVEVVKTYIASQEKVPFIDIISDLSSYVAKPTHLSFSEGLIIVKNGINMLTGKPISPEEVQKSIFKSFERKPREVESWLLHQVPPGFMIQEYVPMRMEVKIQTVWGKAIIGEWRGGETKKKITKIWGRYDHDGNKVWGRREAPEWWPKAIAAAEQMAQGTDALRIDFLVKVGGILLLNELAFWTESDWRKLKTALETQLNDGYRKMCKDKNKNIDSTSR